MAPYTTWPLAALESRLLGASMKLVALCSDLLGTSATKLIAWIVSVLVAGLWGLGRLLSGMAGRSVDSLLVEMLSTAHLATSQPRLGFRASDLPPDLPPPVASYLAAALPEGEPPPK